MVPASRPLYQQPLAISLGSAFIAITLTTVTTFLVRSPLRSGLFASFATIFIIQFLTPKGKPRYLKSPAATLLPQLSSSEIEALPLPLDALPGGRFVESPVSPSKLPKLQVTDIRNSTVQQGSTNGDLKTDEKSSSSTASQHPASHSEPSPTCSSKPDVA